MEQYGASDGLGESNLRDPQVDTDGGVWVSTGVGLAHLKNGKISVLSHKNGLPCDAVHIEIDWSVDRNWHPRRGVAIQRRTTEPDKSRISTDREEGSQEFKRKLWLERLSAYRSIAGLAGQIAAYPKPDKKFDGLVQSFDSSYWGLMVLVEDENVEQQMIKFHLAIEDYKKKRISDEKLKQHADLLVQTCKTSLKTGLFE